MVINNESANKIALSLLNSLAKTLNSDLRDMEEKFNISLRRSYKEYILTTSKKYSKSKTFFFSNKSVDLYKYYVPTGIKCDDIEIEEPNISKCLLNSNRIAIFGSGGTGKSVLMKHLFLDSYNTCYVPILIELRELNTEYNLNKAINDYLNKNKFYTTGKYYDKAVAAGHFLFLLDGYDEIRYDLREKVVSEIQALSDKADKCPIFISSRPEDELIKLENFSIFKIQPLKLNNALLLIEKLPFDENVKNIFMKEMEESLFVKHFSFLSNPLLLSIMLLTFGENADIPSRINIFYNQAFNALFNQHDAKKGGYKRQRRTNLDIQEFAKVFSVFSLISYDKRMFTLTSLECIEILKNCQKITGIDYLSEHFLEDMVKSVCLMIEDGLNISFTHRSFQEYFCAKFISEANTEIQRKLLNKYLPSTNSDTVLKLVSEMNLECVEINLLQPHLEKLFKNINVKKSITDENYKMYLSLYFKSIGISDGRISSIMFNKTKSVFQLLNLIDQIKPDYFEKNIDIKVFDLKFEKYGKSNINININDAIKDKELFDKINVLFHYTDKKYLKFLFEYYNAIKRKIIENGKSLKSILDL